MSIRSGTGAGVSKAAILLMSLVLVASCGPDDTGGGESEVTIVVTTTVLGDVVSSVVGDRAAVEVLLPVGADPHAYQPSSQQVAAMETADLVVVNGLGLEEGLVDVIEGLEADGAAVLEVAPAVDPVAFEEDHGHGDHEEDRDHAHDARAACDLEAGHDHDAGDHHDAGDDHDTGDDHDNDDDHDAGGGAGCDPHVWMDPLRMADAAMLVADELTVLAPDVDWSDGAEAYADRLTELDEEIREILATVPDDRRVIVTNHDSLGYFADRYGLEVLGTVVPGGTTLSEPSSAELSELVDTMRSAGLQALFAETSNPGALADAVADELGDDVAVVELYTGSLGEPGSDAATYVDMLRADAHLIAEALS